MNNVYEFFFDVTEVDPDLLDGVLFDVVAEQVSAPDVGFRVLSVELCADHDAHFNQIVNSPELKDRIEDHIERSLAALATVGPAHEVLTDVCEAGVLHHWTPHH